MSLLRLYPARYRAADEILDVHRELTADLSRIARLRADADLVAHALRVRVGLDSASAAGSFFSVATPFALAVAAAYSGIQLMRWYAAATISPGSTWSHVVTVDGPQALNLLLLAMIFVGGLAMRWRLGAVLAVVGLLGFAVAPDLYGPLEAVAAALTAFVVLACPPDRRGDKQLSALAGLMAAVAWFPVALVQTRNFIVSTDYGAWPLLTVALTVAVLIVGVGLSGPRALGVLAVASPLFLAHALTQSGIS